MSQASCLNAMAGGSFGAPCWNSPAAHREVGFPAGSGPTPWAHLIDREANGLHVPAKAALAATVLLHEGEHETAA